MHLYPRMEMTMRMASRKARQQTTPTELDRAPGYLRKSFKSMEHRCKLRLKACFEKCEGEDSDWG
jgi:hypothetical protein